MKPHFIRPNRLSSIIFFFLSLFIFKNNSFSQGTATGVPTFHCIGVYWSGSGGSAGTACAVQYRVAGSSAWKNGYPLWFDDRGVGGRPSNEYRGSIIGLQPGTNYEIQLTAGSATKTFTAATWSETFPAGSTTNLSSATTISTSGTPAAYRVYTGSISGGTNNITVDASYIIIRNMTLTGAGQDAIVLGQNAHHVVIEGCDISGWGQIGMGSDNQGAIRIKGFSYNASNVKQIIIQRNKIHDSRENSNSWDDGGHPQGPNAITFDESGGNHVIRYNEIYTSSSPKKFMDGIGGGDNFTFTGAPGANSDIYANKIEDVYDDAIESEGGNCNVRIWGNWIDNTFTGIATAANSIGPMYVWNNVSNLSVRSSSTASAGTIDNEDRGPFNKCGSPDDTYSGGRTYLFHNTILQPTQSGYSYPRGMAGGPVDNGGAVTNVFSRNNIWQTFKPNYPSIGEYQSAGNSGNTYDYDLYNGSLQIQASGIHESNGINGAPAYASGVPLTGPNPSGYFLASNSNGVDDGMVLNNFNDGYTGSAPDIGAYEIGKPALQFGVNAYLTNSPPPNQPPVANAGNDITITLPIVTTTLNGSASDTDGTIVNYSWTKVSGPTSFILGSANAAITTLLNLVQGTYVFRLTVTDNGGATATDDVTVTVNPLINLPPTANAGPDRILTLPVNSTTLNGSGTDLGGTISSYAWTRVSGPTTFILGSPNTGSTTLNGLVQGIYVFRLTVTDNNGATATDDVTVTVNEAPNQSPVADAGTDKTLTLPVNSTTLNGSGSDPDGTISSYAWIWVSGPNAFTLENANAATTTLSNLVQGTYVFRLTVTDNDGATDTDSVTVTVNEAPNQSPVVNAGTDKTLTLPANSTTLNGSGSDTDGTINTYSWTRVSGPAIFTLGNASAATTTLSNLVQGIYVFRLTVTDDDGATASDDVAVTVNAAPNQPPTAHAGTDITLTLPENFTFLNGSGTDPDGAIASYAWSGVSGPTTYTLSSANSATTTLNNLVQGTYVFRLTVTDNNGATGTDDVTVVVNNSATNQPPAVNAGYDKTIILPAPTVATLNGSANDADGTITSYAWSKVSGPASGALSNTNTATATASNLVVGTYVFRLMVTDNTGATATDELSVTVINPQPLANAGTDKTLTLPANSTTLNGSGSDPDGTISAYAWTKVGGPDTFSLGTANEATTTLSNLVQGTYVFRLTVTDNNGATGKDDVSVIVNTPAPPSSDNVGTASGVSTFESIGLYWSGSGGSASTVCNVKYRVAGSGSAWKDGYPLWFDSRAAGGRPANEYRGSLTGLQPGTNYEIQLTAGSATNTFTQATWTENFPIGSTQIVSSSSSTLNITTSGTSSGYRLYTPAAEQTATINVNNGSDNCIYINAAYVIIRGLILKDARQDAILLGPDAHDIVIENNDISGWGSVDMGTNNQAGVRVKGPGASNVVRIIIQRNKIHESRGGSNSWDDGGDPQGPNGINFENTGGNHVIRYNDIYGSAAHYFADGIGGGNDHSYTGFPNANTDIYGNKVSQVYDDAIEAEGGNCNVRIWGNFMDNFFTGIANEVTSVGPGYIFRNVTNISQRSSYGSSPATIDNEDRGPFNKCGSPDTIYRGGRAYLFHNTVLQPVESGYTYTRGTDCGPADNGGPVTNLVSRNNIWQSFRSNHASIVEWQNGSSDNNYDYDLYNTSLIIRSNGTHESHGIRGTPTYTNGVPLALNPAGYFLAPSSDGVDAGEILFGFNDEFTGSKPDMGAYESGKPALQFGTDAYLPSYRIVNETAQVVTVKNNNAVTKTENNSNKTVTPPVNPGFTVYPNPTSGELSLHYESGINGKFNISIFDANNKLVWTEAIEKRHPIITRAMDVSRYPSGVYIIQIISADKKEKWVTKFAKM